MVGVNHALRAAEWIKANSMAMAMMQRYAERVLSAGKKCGIGLIVERLRWEWIVEVNHDDTEDFKINNSHRAYIVRELIRRNPALRNVFDTRRAAWEAA